MIKAFPDEESEQDTDHSFFLRWFFPSIEKKSSMRRRKNQKGPFCSMLHRESENCTETDV